MPPPPKSRVTSPSDFPPLPPLYPSQAISSFAFIPSLPPTSHHRPSFCEHPTPHQRTANRPSAEPNTTRRRGLQEPLSSSQPFQPAFHDQNTKISNDHNHDRVPRRHPLNPTGARASEELGVESEEREREQDPSSHTIFNHRAVGSSRIARFTSVNVLSPFVAKSVHGNATWPSRCLAQASQSSRPPRPRHRPHERPHWHPSASTSASFATGPLAGVNTEADMSDHVRATRSPPTSPGNPSITPRPLLPLPAVVCRLTFLQTQRNVLSSV